MELSKELTLNTPRSNDKIIIDKEHLTLGSKHHPTSVSHQELQITKASLAEPLAAFSTKELVLMNAFNAHNRLLLAMCQFLKNIEIISLKLPTQNVLVLICWLVSFLE